MRYIILGQQNQFISGIYYSYSEAQRGLERYILSQSKRFPQIIKDSLKIVGQSDSEPPVSILNALRDEMARRILNDSEGTIYSKPLLESHIRTRIFGLNGHYYEVTPIARMQALTALLSSNAIKESEGVLTRTGDEIELHVSIQGLRSYSTQRA